MEVRIESPSFLHTQVVTVEEGVPHQIALERAGDGIYDLRCAIPSVSHYLDSDGRVPSRVEVEVTGKRDGDAVLVHAKMSASAAGAVTKRLVAVGEYAECPSLLGVGTQSEGTITRGGAPLLFGIQSRDGGDYKVSMKVL